ncbi:hypothetical protein [Burkholderia phage CSP3]|nr:hypothetical protein [Burkholderia phage CSP3]
MSVGTFLPHRRHGVVYRAGSSTKIFASVQSIMGAQQNRHFA